jgi:GW (Gly-Tryp) dipeptide domain
VRKSHKAWTIEDQKKFLALRINSLIYKDMKLQSTGLVFSAIVALFLISCQGGSDKKVADLAPNAHQVKAEEVIQASAYTYVRVSDDGRDYWMAITKMDVKTGGTYFWSDGAEMKEFTSKELKRTFRSIFFVQDFSSEPITSSPHMQAAPQTGQQPAMEQKGISVKKAEGGVTIAELYAGKKSFEGKTIKIRGQVVKFAGGIMNKNWIHIQDGTKDGEHFDLTITSLDSLKVGDVAVFEGKVVLDKDLGAGYFYDILIEDSKVKK